MTPSLALLPFLLAAPVAAAVPSAVDAGKNAVIPCTSGSSRAGVPVVVVSAPQSPWAVVQLHVRVAGEAIPQELRAQSEALAWALADGRSDVGRPGARARVQRAHGETQVHVSEDAIVISDGVPAAALEEALLALEERLQRRRRLLLSSSAPASLAGERRVPLVVRQSLAPAHPYAQPLTTPSPSRDAALALADLVLRRDGVVVVVIGNEPEARLRARVERSLKTTLPTGAKPPVPLEVAAGARVVEGAALKERSGTAPRGLFSWLWWQTPGLRTATAEQRAAQRTLAAVLGAEAGTGDAAGFLSWHVPLTSLEQAPQAEARRLERLEAIAGGELDDAAAKAAAERARTTLLRELTAPEALARALGEEALAGRACTLEAELSALTRVKAADLKALATSLVVSGRLAVRGAGAPLGEAP